MTKEQRREIYWQAYFVSLDHDYICDFCINGLCYLIRVLTDDTSIYHSFEILYPELWVQRPKVNRLLGWWYDSDKAGWRKRRRALLKAIELTYK